MTLRRPMHCLVVAGGNLPPSSRPALRRTQTNQSADLALTMSVVHYHFSKVTAIAGTPAKKKMAAGGCCIFLLHAWDLSVPLSVESISFSQRPAGMLYLSAPSQSQGYTDSYAVIL